MERIKSFFLFLKWFFVRFWHGFGRRWTARGSAAAFVALTLYIVHKSPSLAQDWIWLGGTNDGSSVSQTWASSNAVEGVFVEDVFDFTVPVGVISQGVHDAEMPLLWSIPDDIESDFFDYVDNLVTNTIPSTLDDFSFSLGYYYENTNKDVLSLGDVNSGSFLGFSVHGSPYSMGVFDALTSSNTDLLGTGRDAGFMEFHTPESMVDVMGDVGSDSTTIVASYKGPITGDDAPPEFYPHELTEDMITSLDGGRLLELCQDPPTILGCLKSIPDCIPHICDICNSTKVMRKIVSIGATVLFFIMFFKWWLRRIFYILEIFVGEGPVGRQLSGPSMEDWSK